MSNLSPGDDCWLVGLKGRPEINGRHVILDKWVEEKQRWRCRPIHWAFNAPGRNSPIGVKPDNLTKTPPETGMDIGDGTDDDPFMGLKQAMAKDGLDPSGVKTFRMTSGAKGEGATLEECLANAQADSQRKAPWRVGEDRGLPDRGFAVNVQTDPTEVTDRPLFSLRLTKPVETAEQITRDNSEVVCLNADKCPAGCRVVYPPWEDVHASISRNKDVLESIQANSMRIGRPTAADWEQVQREANEVREAEEADNIRIRRVNKSRV